ncbi:hypothetical protein OEZ86_014076 [Tetradesmus obliquus]|nr:hypothetical protein OEZ86_014076 [Tetradesmus obliquus]
MMPGKSKKQLQEHDAWYTAACLHQRRAADLAAAWQRQQASFLADSCRMLAEAAAAAAAGAEAAAARLAWEAAGGLLAGQLAELQQARQQEQQVGSGVGLQAGGACLYGGFVALDCRQNSKGGI